MNDLTTERTGGAIRSFAFGDPEPVLDRSILFPMFQSWTNGKWYEPPMSLGGLARSLRVSTHHASALNLKVNLLAGTFRPSRWLTRNDFARLAMEFLLLGNGYLQAVRNMAGRPMMLKTSPALYTRRGVEDGRYFWVPAIKAETEFEPGSIFHMIEADPEQELYGLPQWLAALQPALLAENATLFRRRYYLNGSHAGFILYVSEPTVDNESAAALEEAVKGSKGLGNFKNLFLHAPNGKKDGVQLIPISEVAAKDEFMNIKNCTRDDILAAHRVPPQLIGVIPTNNGGFGDADTAMRVFFKLEIEPLQSRFLEINEWLGLEAVAFTPFAEWMGTGG